MFPNWDHHRGATRSVEEIARELWGWGKADVERLDLADAAEEDDMQGCRTSSPTSRNQLLSLCGATLPSWLATLKQDLDSTTKSRTDSDPIQILRRNCVVD